MFMDHLPEHHPLLVTRFARLPMVVVDSHGHSRFVLYPLDVVVTESVGADVDLEVVVEERAHTVSTLRVVTHTEGFVDEHVGVFVRDVGQTNVHVLASVVDQVVGESLWWGVGWCGGDEGLS